MEGAGRGATPPTDGAFERFLTSAIATILTIIFSWRLLLDIQDPQQVQQAIEAPSQRNKEESDVEMALGQEHQTIVQVGQEPSKQTPQAPSNVSIIEVKTSDDPIEVATSTPEPITPTPESPGNKPVMETVIQIGRPVNICSALALASSGSESDNDSETCSAGDDLDEEQGVKFYTRPSNVLFDERNYLLDDYDSYVKRVTSVTRAKYNKPSDDIMKICAIDDMDDFDDFDSSDSSDDERERHFFTHKGIISLDHDSSSDSEHCQMLNRPLDVIAEEETDDMPSTDKDDHSLAHSRVKTTTSGDGQNQAFNDGDDEVSTECEVSPIQSDTGSIDIQVDDHLPESQPEHMQHQYPINTQYPLVIGTYTDRSSAFARDRYINANKQPQAPPLAELIANETSQEMPGVDNVLGIGHDLGVISKPISQPLSEVVGDLDRNGTGTLSAKEEDNNGSGETNSPKTFSPTAANPTDVNHWGGTTKHCISPEINGDSHGYKSTEQIPTLHEIEQPITVTLPHGASRVETTSAPKEFSDNIVWPAGESGFFSECSDSAKGQVDSIDDWLRGERDSKTRETINSIVYGHNAQVSPPPPPPPERESISTPEQQDNIGVCTQYGSTIVNIPSSSQEQVNVSGTVSSNHEERLIATPSDSDSESDSAFKTPLLQPKFPKPPKSEEQVHAPHRKSDTVNAAASDDICGPKNEKSLSDYKLTRTKSKDDPVDWFSNISSIPSSPEDRVSSFEISSDSGSKLPSWEKVPLLNSGSSSDNLENCAPLAVLSLLPTEKKPGHDVSLQTNIDSNNVWNLFPRRQLPSVRGKYDDAELSGCLERNPKGYAFVRQKSVERDYRVIRTTRYKYGSVPDSDTDRSLSPNMANIKEIQPPSRGSMPLFYQPDTQGEPPPTALEDGRHKIRAGIEFEEYEMSMHPRDVEKLFNGRNAPLPSVNTDRYGPPGDTNPNSRQGMHMYYNTQVPYDTEFAYRGEPIYSGPMRHTQNNRPPPRGQYNTDYHGMNPDLHNYSPARLPRRYAEEERLDYGRLPRGEPQQYPPSGYSQWHSDPHSRPRMHQGSQYGAPPYPNNEMYSSHTPYAQTTRQRDGIRAPQGVGGYGRDNIQNNIPDRHMDQARNRRPLTTSYYGKIDMNDAFFQPPDPYIGRAKAMVSSPLTPEGVRRHPATAKGRPDPGVVVATSCVMKNKVDEHLQNTPPSKGAIGSLPYKIDREQREREAKLSQMQDRKISITIEQNKKGTLQKEMKTVECNIPGSSGDQDLVAMISNVVKTIVSSEASPLGTMPNTKAKQALDEAVEKVSRQVLMAYQSSSMSSTNSYPPATPSSKSDSSDYTRLENGHYNQEKSGMPKFFYVTGTGKECPEDSGFTNDVILRVETDDDMQPNVEHVQVSEAESGSEVETPKLPRKAKTQPKKTATFSRPQGKSSQLNQAKDKKSGAKSDVSPKEILEPSDGTKNSIPSKNISATVSFGNNMDGIHSQQGKMSPSHSREPQSTGYANKTDTSSVKADPVNGKPARAAGSGASVATPIDFGIKDSLFRIEQMINDRFQDQSDFIMNEAMNEGKKPYESVLQKPVKDGPTSMKDLKRFEIPEKEVLPSRLKINEQRKSFIANESKLKPILKSPTNESRKDVLSSRREMMVVDIDIDDIPRIPSSGGQKREEIKQKLQSIKHKAPAPVPIEKHWNASAKIKQSKSHGTSLNQVGLPHNTKESPPVVNGCIFSRSKSLQRIPQQFFHDKRSYTSLLETDIDTLEHKETPLIHETNLDSAHFKTQSMVNLNHGAIRPHEFSSQHERPKSMVLYSLPDDQPLDENTLLNSQMNAFLQDSPMRSKSAHELRISQSLNKLNIPSWYRQSDIPPVSVGLTNTHRDLSNSFLDSNTSNTESVSQAVSPRLDNARPVVIQHRVSAPNKLRSPISSICSSPVAEAPPKFELPSERLRKQNQAKNIKPVQVRSLEDILSESNGKGERGGKREQPQRKQESDLKKGENATNPLPPHPINKASTQSHHTTGSEKDKVSNTHGSSHSGNSYINDTATMPDTIIAQESENYHVKPSLTSPESANEAWPPPPTDLQNDNEEEDWPPVPDNLLDNNKPPPYLESCLTSIDSEKDIDKKSANNTHSDDWCSPSSYMDSHAVSGITQSNNCEPDSVQDQHTDTSDLPTFSQSPNFGRRFPREHLINSQSDGNPNSTLSEDMTRSRKKEITVFGTHNEEINERKYTETDFSLNTHDQPNGSETREYNRRQDNAAPTLFMNFPPPPPLEAEHHSDCMDMISGEEKFPYSDFMKPLEGMEELESGRYAREIPRHNSPDKSRNSFPVLSFANSPTSMRKRSPRSRSPPMNSHDSSRIQVTMTESGFAKKRPDSREEKSLEEVLDGLLAIQQPGNFAEDDTDDADEEDFDESPQGRIFQLLRQAQTPQGSINSIHTRSSESLVMHYGDDPSSPTRSLDQSDGSENRDKMTEEVAIVKCRNPKCKKSTELQEARKSYKTCHNCYTYYCSRECRKTHWERHKKKCLHSRVNSACKHVIRKIHDDDALSEYFTKVARTGYLSKGRGCVMLVFTSLEKAENFTRMGMEGIDMAPSYVSSKEFQDVDVFGDHMFELIDMCKQYKPDIKFVIDVAIVAGKEIPAWPLPRREGPTIKKCAKLRLHAAQNVTRQSRETETMILTAVPGSEFTENMEEKKAREVCFINMQRKLRQRGVSLRHQFPEAYNMLCNYVANNEHFSPLTIYPIDATTGKRFMCLIMPNSEAEVEWIHNPNLMEELGLSTSV